MRFSLLEILYIGGALATIYGAYAQYGLLRTLLIIIAAVFVYFLFVCKNERGLRGYNVVRKALTKRYWAFAVSPHDAGAWNRKGEALRSLGRYERAIACFDDAIKLDPHYIEPHDNKGEALRSLGRNDEAEVCYDDTLAIDERDPRAWNGKGEIRRISGNCKEALVCYNKALESDPSNEYALANKGKCIKELRRHSKLSSSSNND